MSVNEINLNELMTLLEEKDEVEIIDVRTEQEFEGGHMDNSKNIPMGVIVERANEIDWTKKVVFVCRSGARSGAVAQHFSDEGKGVYNLLGGVFGV